MTLTHHPQTAAGGVAIAPPTAAAALTAAGVISGLGCAAYIASVVAVGDLEFNEAVRTPLVVTANVLATAGLVAMGLLLPLVAGRLRTWAVLVSAAGLIMTGAFAWTMATIAPHFGALVDADAFAESSGFMDAVAYPKMVLCVVGLVGLAVTSWRGRLLPRPLAALLAAGGVAALLWPYPPGGLLASAAVLGIVFHQRAVARHGATA